MGGFSYCSLNVPSEMNVLFYERRINIIRLEDRQFEQTIWQHLIRKEASVVKNIRFLLIVSLILTLLSGAAQLVAAQEVTDTPAPVPTADSSNPIKIGISLSLSGDFSADGQGFQQGYQRWADTVNTNGGLLGREVVLDIVSDASSPDQVQTNYQKLITVDHCRSGLWSLFVSTDKTRIGRCQPLWVCDGGGSRRRAIGV